MSLTKRSNIIGKHAFLSPSGYHWLDYDEDKLRRVYFQKQQAKRGDDLHAYAQMAIKLKQRQPDNGTTMSMYINDAIGFRMDPEVPLYYSEDCFGTADAACFRNDILRISDLKTGLTPGDMRQLKIYAGLFFLDYGYDPREVTTILRLYQNDAVDELTADPAELLLVMSRIREASALIAELREED